MTPLFDAVYRYRKVRARFHMPSHGGGRRPLAAGLFASAPFDLTELSFSDNLSSPTGVILEAEKLAAAAYGSERTLFFAGGATDAVRTALLASKGERIAFFGDMHKSFHSAARLFSLSVTEVASLRELSEGDFDVICVTSPDYYGRTADIPAIAAICAERKAKLIVDEAHGAHFAFSSLLPESAVIYADFVIHGAHKTLPVYTGGAMLHTKTAFYDAARAARAEVIGTSPSYLVMASLDYARDLFQRKGERYYRELKKKIERAKRAHPGVKVLPAEDFTRVVIERRGGGHALAAALEKRGIYAEASDSDRVVLICTPFNGKYLKKAFSLAESFDGKNKEYPDISDLIGKISARDVGVYPPGVPLVKKGEIFTKEKVAVLQANLDRLFGTVDGKILTE